MSDIEDEFEDLEPYEELPVIDEGIYFDDTSMKRKLEKRYINSIENPFKKEESNHLLDDPKKKNLSELVYDNNIIEEKKELDILKKSNDKTRPLHYSNFDEDYDLVSDEDEYHLMPEKNDTALIPVQKGVFEIEVDEKSCNIISLVNNSYNSYEMIELEQRREDLGLHPLFKCHEIPGHADESKLMCFDIIENLSKHNKTVKIIELWCRNQVFPEAKTEIENRLLAIYILFAQIELTLHTKAGIVFFESFSDVSKRFDLKPNYNIPKYRFSFPENILDNLNGESDNSHLFLSPCFYAPMMKPGNNTEIKNFAHNDLLNEYSFKLRKNLLISLIYFKLRIFSNDQKLFVSLQKDFHNIFIYISFLMYNKMSDTPINRFIAHLVKEMTNFILDVNLYEKVKSLNKI